MNTATEDKQMQPIMVYSPNRWDDTWTSRHRIALGLAERGWPTIYSIGAFPPGSAAAMPGVQRG